MKKVGPFFFSRFGITVLETKFVVNKTENIKANLKFQSYEQGLLTQNGNGTERSSIWSVIIQAINKI